MLRPPGMSEYEAAGAGTRLRALAASPPAPSRSALPYRIAWGGPPETIDISYAPPDGLALESHISHFWGFMVGSSHLGDREADLWLLKAGERLIRTVAEPTPAHTPFLECLLLNVSTPYKAGVVKWALNRVCDPAISQPFLLTAWRLWHVMVQHAAGWDQARLIEWFRRSRFAEPRGEWLRSVVQPWMLDDRMTVYRGGWGVRPEVLAQGLSWSPDRACAAFMATRFRRGGGGDPGLGPTIVSREIGRAEVLMSVFLSPPLCRGGDGYSFALSGG